MQNRNYKIWHKNPVESGTWQGCVKLQFFKTWPPPSPNQSERDRYLTYCIPLGVSARRENKEPARHTVNKNGKCCSKHHHIFLKKILSGLMERTKEGFR